MHNFKNLEIWKRSLEFSIQIIEISRRFPSAERFELTSQINRSAISIPSNIAEGSIRTTNKEFSRFLDIALGSAFELETQLIIAGRIGNIPKAELDNLLNELNEIQKMTRVFRDKLS